MKKLLIIALALFLTGCSGMKPATTEIIEEQEITEPEIKETAEEIAEPVEPEIEESAEPEIVEPEITEPEIEEPIEEIISELEESEAEITEPTISEPEISLADYTGEPYEIINGNHPFFESYEYTTDPFEYYSSLDDLGRCGEAYANICKELMPTEARESISQVKPSGWNNKPYDFIEGGYVYNRCHLIAFELAGENANELNLITGTRYFNVTGMLPFENAVADYVRETDHHVLYRVTPVFEGDNLVADGVLMEAHSVEDEEIEFCVFVFNVQPGVTIDYATGENWEDDHIQEDGTYILNTNSMKFHASDCSNAASISDANKQVYTGNRQVLIDEGYSPCGVCNP